VSGGNSKRKRRYALLVAAFLLASGLLWLLYHFSGRGPANTLTRAQSSGVAVKPLTRAQFNKIIPNMLEEDVIKILGPPASKGQGDPQLVGSRDFDMLTWEDGRIKIVVGFYDGKVMSTKLIDLTKK